MDFTHFDFQDDKRVRELVRIRQIFVPELIIRLHSMLYVSRTRIPESVSFPYYFSVDTDNVIP